MAKYTRICQDCGDTKKVSDKKTASAIRCNPCQFKYRVANHVRICEDCGDMKKVKSISLASAKKCRKCADKWRVKNPVVRKKVEPKVRKPKARGRPITKHISKEAVARQRAINKEHREEVANYKITPVVTEEQQSEMIRMFLKANKPSVETSTQ